MAKTYADQLAGRLDVVSPDAFRALERTVRKALENAGPPPPTGPTVTPRDARIKGVPAGSPERREIVGALIEYPSLLDDPAVASVLPLLEGNSARIIALLAQSLIEPPSGSKKDAGTEKIELAHEKALDTAVFLEQIPAAVQGLRAAAPGRTELRHEGRGERALARERKQAKEGRSVT